MATDSAKLRNLIRDVSSEIVTDPEVRKLIKEVVLMTLVEQEQVRKTGIVRSFISDCGARGIRVRLADNGKLMFSNASQMTTELRVVLQVEREAIVAHLEQLRFIEVRHQMQYEKDRAAKNGKPPAAARP